MSMAVNTITLSINQCIFLRSEKCAVQSVPKGGEGQTSLAARNEVSIATYAAENDSTRVIYTLGDDFDKLAATEGGCVAGESISK